MGRNRLAVAALATVLVSCGPAATSTLQVQVWGEEFIPQQIPPMMGSNPGFSDGWTLRYTRFLVNIGGFSFNTNDGARMGSLPGYAVWDLHRVDSGPVSLGTVTMLAPMRYDQVTYAIAPATAQSTAGNAQAADMMLMRSNGYSVYLEGTATHATQGMFSFAWGFTNNTGYTHCQDANMQNGLVVQNGLSTVQLTIHGDHPYYDDLQSPEASTRFTPIAAADANHDRMITLDELGMLSLTNPAIPANAYGTGSVPNVRTMRDFITTLVSTIGHFQGEGHCEEVRR